MLNYDDNMIDIQESGSGRPILILHGGGGPGTVAVLATHLAGTSLVIAPTHPGWNGTERPERIDSIRALADEYLRYLDERDLQDVLVIGSSIGGWLAAEMALADASHRITGLVIIDGGGIGVPGQPITDISGLSPQELARISFHDPAKFAAGAPAPTPASIAVMAGNRAALVALTGGPDRYDQTLRSRLGGIRIPALVVWGASDGVMSVEYGRAFAAAIPGAGFELVQEAGHLPHLEQPDEVFALIDGFAARAGSARLDKAVADPSA